MAAEPIRDSLSELVSAAVQVSAAGDLDHYLRWNLLNLLHELNEDDYTRDELMAMNVINAQALSRKLGVSELLPSGHVFSDPFVIAGVAAKMGGERRLSVVSDA